MRLDDVGIATIEQVKILARLAPKEEKDTAPGMDQATKSRQRRSPGVDLGRLDVEAYLRHYGIEYNVKSGRGKTFYRLSQCLFDPSHTKNEASIVQDGQGLLTYQCFHNSCQGRKWTDARALISGADPLASFCENYDPALYVAGDSPPPSSFDTGKDPAVALPPASPPEEVSPNTFFKKTKKGKKFVPQFLAKYLQSYFQPIVWDGGEFYRYADAGVWRPAPWDLLGQVAEKALDSEAKSAWIHDAVKLLTNRAYRNPEELRHDPNWLNLRNGMLHVDMQSLDLKPHDPSYMSRIQLPVEFRGNAKCEPWLRYLDQVFPEEPDKAETLQKYYGYCLLPDCRFQRCLFMIGSGANGKSVAVDVLVEVLGAENVCSLPLQLMGERFLIGQLKDKLVNVATELATNQPIQTANFKDAVAGGLLMADRKHGQPFSFYPVAKHIFSMNEVPKITDKSYGFQRRPVVLTFNETFEGEKADRHLTRKLAKEKEGIFAWMLEGLAKVLDAGELIIPESVERDTQEFVKSTNPVLLFVDDCCLLGPEYQCRPKELYGKYDTWCGEGHNRPLSRNRFYDQIMIHFPKVVKGQFGESRQRMYKGIGLIVEGMT